MRVLARPKRKGNEVRPSKFIVAIVSFLLPLISEAQVIWVPFQGSEYSMSSIQMTWHEGLAYAVLQGGHLACITTPDENEFVRNTFRNIHLWLGASDEAHEGVWLWITGEAFAFTQWCAGEPNNAIPSEDYLHFDTRYGGCWNDLYINHPAARPYALIERSIESVDANESPARFQLEAPYPNPFNPVTTLPFSLEETGPVRLQVFDLSGHVVATLVDGLQERGAHEVTFDGSGLSSGLYVARLTTEAGGAAQKLVLSK